MPMGMIISLFLYISDIIARLQKFNNFNFNRMKKKFLTLFLALITGTIAFAHDAAIGNIYYLLDSDTKTATVTYRGNSGSSYNEYSGEVIIPENVTYNGVTYSVTSIGSSAFYDCSSLTSITIPNSVTSIDSYAFSNCSSLTSITIPNSVTSIEDWAFSSCSSLTAITIPNSVTSIGSYAFSSCSSLTSVTIGDSVKSIEDHAFYGCSSLTSVTIPNSVTSIGDAAFYGCSSLTSITIPNSVTSIGSYAFSDCSSLISVTIGNSVTSISSNAFQSCKSLSMMIFKGVNPPNFSGVVINSSYNSGTPVCYIPCGSLEAYVLKFYNYMKQFVEQSPYSITINSSNDAYGIAKVASRPDCNSAILTAIPNEGCTFVKWSDGNTQATRYLEVTEDISLTAYFAKEGYTIHVYQDCNTTIE